MKIERSMQIAARPEKVWLHLTNPEKIRQWYFTLTQFEFAGEQVGEGTLIRIEDTIENAPIKIEAKVMEWITNERFGFEMTSGDGVKAYTQHWMIEKSSYGTRMTLMANIDLEVNLVKVIGSLFRRSTLEGDVSKMLNKLRDMVETTSSGSRSAA
jgi:uncharacterized protein YndB with AHSA1/START domain